MGSPRSGTRRRLTLAELVEIYLAQHDVGPVTIEKLRWLLAKAIAAFGERPVGELRCLECGHGMERGTYVAAKATVRQARGEHAVQCDAVRMELVRLRHRLAE